jgi:hypothetical protein
MIMHSVKVTGAVAMALFGLAQLASAESVHIRKGFWGGIDAGAGLVELSFDQEEDEDDRFLYLGFKGGYAINPHFLIGIELSGWLLEASDLNDPDEGSGISQVFLITQIYPGSESDFFLKAGGGHVSIWSNASGDTSREQGFGWTMGCGYDFRLDETAVLSPFVTFSYGEAGSWDYTAVGFGISITFP